MSWYLLKTKPRQERRAETHLSRQGYRCYFPECYSDIRQGGIHKRIPLFPCYGFAWLVEGHDDFRPIRSTLGVTGLVRQGGSLARVNASVIDELRANEIDGVHIVGRLSYLPGDHIRVHSGPFKFYQGVVSARTGNDRVKVLLSSLDQNLTVEMDAAMLEPAV